MKDEQIKWLKTFFKDALGVSSSEFEKIFETEDSVKTFIQEKKTEEENSYKDGVIDGSKKISKPVIDFLKKEFDIKVTEKDLEAPDKLANIKPKIEDKLKQEPTTETEAFKELQKKYDEMVTLKDSEIENAKNASQSEIQNLRRESITNDILKTGGFNIPTDPTEQKTKMDMVTSLINSKGYKYDENNNRIAEDGTKVRNGNKPITYQDDVSLLLGFAFGKSPANQKDGSISEGTGSSGGNEDSKSFDWSSIKDVGFKAPTTKDEAFKEMTNPVRSLEERQTFRSFMEQLEQTPTT